MGCHLWRGTAAELKDHVRTISNCQYVSDHSVWLLMISWSFCVFPPSHHISSDHVKTKSSYNVYNVLSNLVFMIHQDLSCFHQINFISFSCLHLCLTLTLTLTTRDHITVYAHSRIMPTCSTSCWGLLLNGTGTSAPDFLFNVVDLRFVRCGMHKWFFKFECIF